MLATLLSSIIERPIWRERPATPGQALVELVILALHQNGYAQRRGIDIPIAYGEVCLSREEMAYRWNWSRNKVDGFLVRLKRYGWIHVRKTPIINVLTFFFSPFFKLYGTAEGTTQGTTEGTTERTTEGTTERTTDNFFREALITSDEKVKKYNNRHVDIPPSDIPIYTANQDFTWAMKMTNEALGINEEWGGEASAEKLQDFFFRHMNGNNGTAQNNEKGTAQDDFQKRKKKRQNERKEPKERKKEKNKEKITNTIFLGRINHKPKKNCVSLKENAAGAATEKDDDFFEENHDGTDNRQTKEKDSLQANENTQKERQQNLKAEATDDTNNPAKIDKKAWKQELTRNVLDEIKRFTNNFADNIEPQEDITRRCSTVCWHKIPVHHLNDGENAYLYILYLRYVIMKCPNICASMKKLPTQQQYLQLVEQFGHRLVNKKTDLLEGYCDRYHYKTLYQPLLDWCQREKQKK